MSQSKIMQAAKLKNGANANIKVLFIGFVWPELTATAASQNIVAYVRTFQKFGYAVHFASAAQQTELSSGLEEFDVQCHSIALNDDGFDQFVSKLAPSIVVFDRFLSEEQFGWRVMKAVPNALRVLDCEDLHFLRHARHALYKQEGYQTQSPSYLNPKAVLQDEVANTLHSDLCLREIACIHRSDLVLLLSHFEVEVLQDHFFVPKSKILHVPYLIDEQPNEHSHTLIHSNNHNNNNKQNKADVARDNEHRKHFISIGNFRHAPNTDAVNILVQHIWPSIRKALPHAECNVFGAYMPPRIKAYERADLGLFMHGHIGDHFSALKSARVLLAPLQFGAGVKGKFIDAFRCGLPSVTTPIGAEGIQHLHWPGVIVSDKASFIERAIALYNASSDEFSQHQSVMHDILDTHFNTQTHQQMMMDAVRYALTNIDKLREAGLLQKLVSHHSLQTHQYMSQWIVAKNQNKAD